MILPERVLGSASVKRISSGRASAPISLRDVAAQLLLQLVGRLALAFERDEGDDALTLQLVGAADDRGLRDRLVRDERALDLHRAQTVAARR